MDPTPARSLRLPTALRPLLAPPRSLGLYHTARALLAGDGAWRRALVDELAPRADEGVLIVGAAVPAFAADLLRRAPQAQVTLVDPDPAALRQARLHCASLLQASQAGGLTLVQAPLTAATEALAGAPPDKVVLPMTLRRLPLADKRALLERMGAGLRPGAVLAIADYGPQRSPVMERLYHPVARADGPDAAGPHWRGELPGLLRQAGFVAVEEAHSLPTATGAVSIYRGRAAPT